jgi:curved DNA-binding protein CbpA
MKNYYQVLGVSLRATQTEIKERFRFLANAYHPDKFPNAEQKSNAEQEFKKINEAYQILSNPTKRADYDHKLGLARPHQGSSSSTRSAPDAYAIGQSIIRMVAFALIFYLVSFVGLRMGLAGVILLLILLGAIYTKYFWK